MKSWTREFLGENHSYNVFFHEREAGTQQEHCLFLTNEVISRLLLDRLKGFHNINPMIADRLATFLFERAKHYDCCLFDPYGLVDEFMAEEQYTLFENFEEDREELKKLYPKLPDGTDEAIDWLEEHSDECISREAKVIVWSY